MHRLVFGFSMMGIGAFAGCYGIWLVRNNPFIDLPLEWAALPAVATGVSMLLVVSGLIIVGISEEFRLKTRLTLNGYAKNKS